MLESNRSNSPEGPEARRLRPTPDPQLSAVLLAGGRSRRMGFDKALLRVGSQPVVQLLANRLRPLTDQVFLSANQPGAYRFLNLIEVPDVYAGGGPLAGLHAAMLRTERPWLLLLACDLPGVTTDLLRRMLSVRADYHVVLPMTADGILHPTCALYHRKCLPTIERNLGAGRNQLTHLSDQPDLRIRRWPADEGAFSDRDLFNVNTPQDYIEFQLLFKS